MSKRLAGKLVIYVLLLIIHWFLIRYLADRQIVATLFSAGAAEHLAPALIALGFVALRLFLVLLLPGLLVCEVVNGILNFCDKISGPISDEA